MRILSLFSGCGGMDFGAEEAGGEVIFANDIDSDACATFRKYFPKCELHEGDISKVKDFPKVDLVMGGYPCQSFSLAGKRNPELDPRTKLYLEFIRCIEQVKPKYFVAENVSGLRGLKNGAFFREQIDEFERQGYTVTSKLLNAKDYGVPQERKRLFIVGIKKHLKKTYAFPDPTHGNSKKNPLLNSYVSHGEVIRDLPLWPTGEFYERPHDPLGHMSWYYMSRNRKKNWDDPAFTVVANWRHITLHPASPTMKLTWSNLADGFKQRWDFTDEYEHLEKDPSRPFLEIPRRLSWRECSRIQTFPIDFEPIGSVESKFQQIGNAVPPKLAQAVLQGIINGDGLRDVKEKKEVNQLSFFS